MEVRSITEDTGVRFMVLRLQHEIYLTKLQTSARDTCACCHHAMIYLFTPNGKEPILLSFYSHNLFEIIPLEQHESYT